MEILSRAIIIENSQVLLCKVIDKNCFFLPGGHIEGSETPMQALEREIKEELGQTLTEVELLGTIENNYFDDGVYIEEINHVFRGKITSRVKSSEPHILFEWIDTDQLENIDLRPSILKTILTKPIEPGFKLVQKN